jgi:hypothetical protein
MKKKAKVALIVLGALAVISLIPISTPVSGSTKITILKENDAPMPGLAIRQTWGVYGWGGFRGEASATTDSTGSVIFPPRRTISFFGPRMFNRAGAFITQCSAILVFGNFGSAYVERWGPIVGIDIDLPAGVWQPAAWKPATQITDDIVSVNLSDGPDRFIYIRNRDPLHPVAYISGNARAFIGSKEVILRLRKATPEEDALIRKEVARKNAFDDLERSKSTPHGTR